jgi:hypothetical protein
MILNPRILTVLLQVQLAPSVGKGKTNLDHTHKPKKKPFRQSRKTMVGQEQTNTVTHMASKSSIQLLGSGDR